MILLAPLQVFFSFLKCIDNNNMVSEDIDTHNDFITLIIICTGIFLLNIPSKFLLQILRKGTNNRIIAINSRHTVQPEVN